MTNPFDRETGRGDLSPAPLRYERDPILWSGNTGARFARCLETFGWLMLGGFAVCGIWLFADVARQLLAFWRMRP